MRRAGLTRIYKTFLTSGHSSRVFHGLLYFPPQTHGNPQKSIVQTVRMASTTSAEEQWTASRVRDTFLGYFKQHGHTFGAVNFTCRKTSMMLIDFPSALIVCRASFGSYLALCQCWHESVQVNLPWHRRPIFRFCTIETSC